MMKRTAQISIINLIKAVIASEISSSRGWSFVRVQSGSLRLAGSLLLSRKKGFLSLNPLFFYFFGMSLMFVVPTEVAILANPFGIHGTVKVIAFIRHFGPPLGMVAILAHTVRIVWLGRVSARGNFLFAFWGPSPCCLYLQRLVSLFGKIALFKIC